MAYISMDEWIKELQRVQGGKSEGFSSREAARHLGISEKTVLRYLRLANDNGWLKSGYRSSISIEGRPCKIPVYRIEKPNKRG